MSPALCPHHGERPSFHPTKYNEANELLTETTDGETTYYHYDACGNTTVKQEPTGTTYYHWDHENLMTRLDLPDGGHSYFAYDADAKRVSKRDGDGFREFIYQGPDMPELAPASSLQMERDEAGETQVRYTMGSALEAMRRASNGIASGDSSFYHFDWLGSTFELTDENQAVTDEYLYNAWGEVLERTGTTENPHGYSGRRRYFNDPDISSLLLGVRRYWSSRGRFLSVDPVATGSCYVYTENSPTLAVDATGLISVPLRHVTVNNVSGGVSGWSGIAAHTWDALTVGQIQVQNRQLTPAAPREMCVRLSAGKQTVILDHWSPGWPSEQVWGLQEETAKEYVFYAHGYRPTPGTANTVPANTTVFWFRSSGLHVTRPGILGLSGLGSGWIFMFEQPLRSSPAPGGTLSHEIGHGVFSLVHTWCGLMYGYASSLRRTNRCLACGKWDKAKSSTDQLRGFGVITPAFRICEANLQAYFPGQPPSICQPDPKPPGGGVLPVRPSFTFLHPGPCQ